MPEHRRVAPGPGRESVWDYPRPPRVEDTGKRIRVVLGGVDVADTRRALRVLETSHPPVFYIPFEDVQMAYFAPSRHRTFCEFKGDASYYDIAIGGVIAREAAWTYAHPEPGYEALRGHLAVYPGKVDACYVDGEPARPQPGGFYGGWITDDVVGPFKGEPGSQGW